MLKPAYSEKRALDTFLIPVVMVQMRIYSDVDCRSLNSFSENERFKLHSLHFTAKLSVLCPMLIGVLFSCDGASFIASVSAVCILYELYKVKLQSASSPVTVDVKRKQKLNI